MKKSHSLPRKLPSNDPILTAAMSHRGAAKQPDHYEDTDSPSLQAGRQPNSSMQLFLPDMPQIVNREESTHHTNSSSHEQPWMASHHQDYSRLHDEQYNSQRKNHNQAHDGPRREELKFGSDSRLSESSRSSNASQDDDDDDIGSLLDLADELGDEGEELGDVTHEEPQFTVSNSLIYLLATVDSRLLVYLSRVYSHNTLVLYCTFSTCTYVCTQSSTC